MLKHIVMWKLKPFAEGASKADNALKIKNLLESLSKKIEDIEHIEVGVDCSKTDSSYDVVLYSEFPNQQVLDNYQNHPEHKRVGDFIGKVRETRIAVDYEI
jgi:hypothetical protein